MGAAFFLPSKIIGCSSSNKILIELASRVSLRLILDLTKHLSAYMTDRLSLKFGELYCNECHGYELPNTAVLTSVF